MRAIQIAVVPLTLAALLVSCQDSLDSHADSLAPSAIPPSLDVSRERIEGGFFFHVIPERGITLTVGLLTPVADLEECGGTELGESDAKGVNQEVQTPAGPLRFRGSFSGTFVVYDAVVFNHCDLATAPIIGTGRGTIRNTDNSLTGVGPGINSFGEVWNAVLDQPNGGKVQLHIVVRQLYDGVNDPEVIVDIFELRPLGK
jgi:hypothetical protein